MKTALILALIELILKYGPNAAIAIIKGLEIDNPTPEQIRALKVKPPEHYLGDENGG